MKITKLAEEKELKYQEYRKIADKFTKLAGNWEVNVDWNKKDQCWEVYITKNRNPDDILYFGTDYSIRMPFSQWIEVTKTVGELMEQETL